MQLELSLRADDDEQSDRVVTASRDCEPNDPRGCLDRRGCVLPAIRACDLRDKIPGHRRRRARTISQKEMKIDDPENGESFGDIEPEQAFHDRGTGLFWSIEDSRARMEIWMRPGDPRRREQPIERCQREDSFDAQKSGTRSKVARRITKL